MLNKKKTLLIFSIILFSSIVYSMEKGQNDGQQSQLQVPPQLQAQLSQVQENDQPLPSASVPAPVDNKGAIEKLDENLNEGIDWIIAHKVRSMLGAVIGTLVLCKVFKKQINERIVKLKESCQLKLIDALIKWEEIKEDGLTKSDYIKGAIALLAASSLAGGIYYNGMDNTKDLIIQFFILLKTYKIEITGALLGIALGKWLYTIKKSYDNRQSRILNFDKFLGELTEEQRRIIFNSEELLVAVGRGGDNHKRLLGNKEFMQLLTETQKSYLENIVRYRCSTV